jgi:hypothetical protein
VNHLESRSGAISCNTWTFSRRNWRRSFAAIGGEGRVTPAEYVESANGDPEQTTGDAAGGARPNKASEYLNGKFTMRVSGTDVAEDIDVWDPCAARVLDAWWWGIARIVWKWYGREISAKI